MSTTVQPDPIEGGLFCHYKGGLYRVLLRGRQESDGTPTLAYMDIGTGRVYFRPEHEFRDLVEHPHISGVKVPRFHRIDNGPRAATEVWTDRRQTEIPLTVPHHPV